MGWEFTLLIVALLCLAVIRVTLLEIRLRKHTKNKETYGVLNVDCTDPSDGAYLYLELAVPIAEVVDRKRVSFDVNVISDSSQK